MVIRSAETVGQESTRRYRALILSISALTVLQASTLLEVIRSVSTAPLASSLGCQGRRVPLLAPTALPESTRLQREQAWKQLVLRVQVTSTHQQAVPRASARPGTLVRCARLVPPALTK